MVNVLDTSRLSVYRKALLVLFLAASPPVLSAERSCVQPSTASPQATDFTELQEVVVTGDKVVRRAKGLAAWLKRLEGQYTYSGHVDLCDKGSAAGRVPITGDADCVGLYDGTNESRLSLYCVVNVHWSPSPGDHGEPALDKPSTLSPAVQIYGVLPDLPGIQSMQIDSKGIATYSRGRLVGDTLTAVEACGLPGDCRKVTRITAQPDSQDITMLIDVQVDSRRLQRHSYRLQRISNIQLRSTPYEPLTRADLLLVGERE